MQVHVQKNLLRVPLGAPREIPDVFHQEDDLRPGHQGARMGVVAEQAVLTRGMDPPLDRARLLRFGVDPEKILDAVQGFVAVSQHQVETLADVPEGETPREEVLETGNALEGQHEGFLPVGQGVYPVRDTGVGYLISFHGFGAKRYRRWDRRKSS